MLSGIRFESFKAWKDSGEIRLAPLTVLFGANSAGKTSIPQLLLLLKQTAESADRSRALQLGDSRSLVELGTFDEALHGHDLDAPLEIALRWTLERPLEIRDPLSGALFAGDELGLATSLVADARRQPRARALRYELRRDGQVELDLSLAERGAHHELASARYPLARRPGHDAPLPAPVRFYGFPEEVAASFENTAFTADLVLELEHMLRSVHALGPLREPPQRLYLWSGEVPEDVGTRGERTIEALLAAGERSFTWAPGQQPRSLPELVAERLRAMGLIHDFVVEPIGPRRSEHEVLVRTSAKLPRVKLTDVGFGVSQVLPVIVECFCVPRRSIVIVEQPEVHLHPRVQAEVADLFVDAIRAREDGAPRDCQFLIESHSEHFLRRLQRRIAEEELSKDDAALYFVHTSDDGTARLEELEVDAYGNIRNWPPGFFGDEMADLVARAEAQARRARGGSER